MLVSYLSVINAVSMITLPSAQVDLIHEKLAAQKPYVMLSPNDASLSSLPLVDIEKYHHGDVKLENVDVEPQSGARNLVELAESLNLTILVKALEETHLDQIIDHEGISFLFSSVDLKLNVIFLCHSGKFTLFAPTDEAFGNIPEWAGNIPLKELLRFHVGRGLIYSANISNELLVRSLLSKRDIRMNVYKVGNILPLLLKLNCLFIA